MPRRRFPYYVTELFFHRRLGAVKLPARLVDAAAGLVCSGTPACSRTRSCVSDVMNTGFRCTPDECQDDGQRKEFCL